MKFLLGAIGLYAAAAQACDDPYEIDTPCGNDLDELDFNLKLDKDAFANINSERWTWFNTPGSQCMDGDSTGFYVRGPLRGDGAITDKVAIYFQGGGACFNAASCSQVTRNRYGVFHTLQLLDEGENPLAQPAVPDGTQADLLFTEGIFEDNAMNYLSDATIIFVPYCSGDSFLGREAGGTPLQLPIPTKFCGGYNTDLMAKQWKRNFKNVQELLVTGSSAGGFGTLASYDEIRRRFRNVPKMALVNDSGPVLDESGLAPCLQSAWASLWKPNVGRRYWGTSEGEQLADIYKKLTRKWDEDTFVIATTDADATIASFYSFGKFDCLALELDPTLLPPPTDPPAVDTDFKASLESTRATYWDSWSSFVVAPDVQSHTFFYSELYYNLLGDGTDVTNGEDLSLAAYLEKRLSN